MRFLYYVFLFFLSIPGSGFGQSTQELTDTFLKLFKDGKYKEALPIALKSVKQAAGEFGPNDVNYAVCCQNVGTTYSELAEWKNSNKWMHEAMRAYEAATGTTDLVDIHLCFNSIGTNHLGDQQYDSSGIYYISAYNYFLQYPEDQYDNLIEVAENLCELSFTVGNYDDVLTITSTLDSLITVKEGKQSQHYYKLLLNKAGAYRQKPVFQSAFEVYRQAEEICIGLFGKNHVEYADLLEKQADCLRNLGRMQECASLLEKSGHIYRNQKSMEPVTLASHHASLANYYGDVAQFVRAFSHYDTALNIMEKAGLEKAFLYGTVIKSKTYTYMDAAMYPEALASIHKTESWFKAQYKDDNPFESEIMISKANIGYFTNQLNSASAQIEEAISLIRKSADSASYLLARCFEIKALIEHGKGNSREAIDLCRQSIKINNRFFGDTNIYAANSLSNLGIIYQELGEYAKAENVLRESFAIKWKIFEGKPHPQIALSLGNWAMVQVMQGRYKDADQLLAASVEILKANNMLGSSNGQAILNNVALLSQKQGDYTSAEKLYRQVMESLSQSDYGNQSVYAIALANMSNIMLANNKPDSALHYSEKTMQSAKQVFGEHSSLYLKAGNNAMVSLGRLNRLDEARKLAASLVPLVSKTMGDSSELMSTTLGNMAATELRSNNFKEAAQLQQRSLDIQLHHYKLNLYALSERDQVSWWTNRSSLFQLQPAILARLDKTDEALVEKMVNQQLQLKGFILNNAKGALKKIRNIQNPKLQQVIDQWQFTRGLYLSEASKPIAERRFSIDSLSYISNALEQSINTLAGNQFKNIKDITWKDVQANLGVGEAAVEYIRYPEISGNFYGDNMRFAAIVITPTGKPKIVNLGWEQSIQWCMAGGNNESRDVQVSKLYRTKIGNVGTVLFTGDSLYKLIWQPLEHALQGARVVHIAPEGILHKVAFPALPLTGDSVLIDRVEVRQYASVRQVSGGASEKISINTAFIAGNADFNLGASEGAITFWTELPGTGKEISTINDFFLSKGKKVVKVETKHATEASVKSTGVPSPDIVHIATHGFFLPEPVADSYSGVGQQKDPAFLSEFADPLLRSGIVLAGANKYWTGERPANSGEDGILTAFELAQLNWENTKVVTLSACETGLGDVQDGEGVFGLKRAMKLAGARFTLVSLWQVPDHETAELMSLFYNHLLSGLPVRAAFNKAQVTMRSKYKPFAWAAFVLSE